MRTLEKKEKGYWKPIWQSGNKFKMMNSQTGEMRNVERDIKGIENGDYLQPVGEDKDAYIARYGSLPDVSHEEVKKFLSRLRLKF